MTSRKEDALAVEEKVISREIVRKAEADQDHLETDTRDVIPGKQEEEADHTHLPVAKVPSMTREERAAADL